jgi:hypothetical protein
METTNYEQIRDQVLHLPSDALNVVRSALLLPSEEQQRLLAELKNRRPVRARRVEPREFSAEQQWLRENRHLYRGQTLAVSGNDLIAHGTDPKEVIEKARASGRDFLISSIPPDGEHYGGGIGRPFYETATPEEWVAAFTNWAESHGSNTPGLTREDVSRERMYEDD